MNSPAASPKYTLAYLAYELVSTKYQAIISIYTLLHQVGEAGKDFQFVIYTDADTSLFTKHLAGLPVHCEVLTKAQVKSFRGPYNYVFRIKPHIIQHCFAKYHTSLLYLDTDTFFLRNPLPLLESITPGHSIMNMEEYNFVDAGTEMLHWFHLRQALKKDSYVVRGTKTQIPLSAMMWNAGIMGINYADAKLVDDIIVLNDALYEKAQTFIVEQFAASYVLQTGTQLRSSEDYIEHYWLKSIKNTFNKEIPGFLAANAQQKGAALYEAAFRFAQVMTTIHTAYEEPLMSRVKGRLKAIAKVARKGHL